MTDLDGAGLDQRSAVLRLPPWLWDGDLSGFATAAGWLIEAMPTGDRWRVRLLERSTGSTSRRLKVNRLAGRANASNPAAYTRLRGLASLPDFLDVQDRQLLAAEVARLQGQHPDDLGAWMAQASLAVLGATPENLIETAQAVLKQGLLPTLRGAELHLLEVDSVIGFRGTALRALLYVQEQPEAHAVAPTLRPDGVTFASAQQLTGDLNVGLGAYLSPLLLSHTPWLWGISVGRAGGVLIFSFGLAVLGRKGQPAEPLQLFAPHNTRSAPQPRPKLAPAQLSDALRWWVRALENLLTEVFDPANYLRDDEFDARRALERHLGVEQLFRTVQSLSTLDRDPIARRTLLFDALDTLQGLTGRKFHTQCTLSHAQRTLDRLANDLPPQVVPVLLPRAAAAVRALRELQDGFFLPSRLTRTHLRLPDGQGHDRPVPLDSAAASWLHMLRNAGHGFGSNTKSNEARDAALLVSHDGSFPAELPDLAYLYLLQLLAHPEHLRRNP